MYVRYFEESWIIIEKKGTGNWVKKIMRYEV